MVLTWDRIHQDHAELLWILMIWIVASEIQEGTSSWPGTLQLPISNWAESLTIKKRPLVLVELAWNVSCKIGSTCQVGGVGGALCFWILLKLVRAGWNYVGSYTCSSLYIWLIILDIVVKCTILDIVVKCTISVSNSRGLGDICSKFKLLAYYHLPSLPLLFFRQL